MNPIGLAFLLALSFLGLAFLIYVLIKSLERHADSETPQGGECQQSDDENLRWVDEPLSAQEAQEKVTTSARSASGRSRCPACGETITVHDDRCPSCEIAFVADGLQRWTLGNVGPPDGICAPPTDVTG